VKEKVLLFALAGDESESFARQRLDGSLHNFFTFKEYIRDPTTSRIPTGVYIEF
jgi:hypothetical protein